MTGSIDIADVASYLQATGWRPTPESWHGARIWARDGDEVLLPARDGLGDTPSRIRDVLRTLSQVEERALPEVVRSIFVPGADTASYRLYEEDQPPGVTGFASGWSAMRGMRNVVASAARVVRDGPHYQFSGQQPGEVSSLLSRVRFVAAPEGEVGFSLLVSLAGEGRVTGRAVLSQLHDATAAAREAVETGDTEAFDDTVTAGVSANFCEALSDLAGQDRRSPFAISFGWAVTSPSELGAVTMRFPRDAGPAVRAGAIRLRHLQSSGPATIIGRIEELHDDPTDRWRVRVRGELRTGRLTEPRRAVWIRLADDQTYQRAIEAHRTSRSVTASGTLASINNRVELSTTPGRFDIDETDPRAKDDRAH